MAFRFALAPLLRLRQSIEKQRAERLQEATLAVARTRESLAQMDLTLAECARADEASLRAGRRGAEIQFAVMARETMLARRQELLFEIERLELARQTRAVEYQHAYREREVLDTVAAQQQRTYQQEQLQREQRDLDANHLLQLWRKRSG